MLMDPLPNIGKVYSLLVQQERQSLLSLDESKILAASSNPPSGRGYSSQRGRNDRGGKTNGGRGKGRGNRVCTHYGMTNHTVDICFKKHGYPPHIQQGGTINNCQNDGDEEDAKSMAYYEDTSEPDKGLYFTPDQHKALLALLQKSSSQQTHSINQISSQPSSNTGILCTFPSYIDSPSSFILDSGATDHICHSIKFFQCMKRIEPINLKLPNGTLVSTSLAGTILFDKNLYITNVLYFPDFSFNLISIPKLTKSLNCFVVFDGTKCLI
jgi:hypothetical protein